MVNASQEMLKRVQVCNKNKVKAELKISTGIPTDEILKIVKNQDFPIHYLAYLSLVAIIDIPVATHCNTMFTIHFCN